MIEIMKKEVKIGLIILLGILIIYFGYRTYIKMECNKISQYEVETVIQKDVFVDWYPEFDQWLSRDFYEFDGNEKLYKEIVEINNKKFEVFINLEQYNGIRVQADSKEKTRPGIYGDLVKYKGVEKYGLVNSRVKAVNEQMVEIVSPE